MKILVISYGLLVTGFRFQKTDDRLQMTEVLYFGLSVIHPATRNSQLATRNQHPATAQIISNQVFSELSALGRPREVRLFAAQALCNSAAQDLRCALIFGMLPMVPCTYIKYRQIPNIGAHCNSINHRACAVNNLASRVFSNYLQVTRISRRTCTFQSRSCT